MLSNSIASTPVPCVYSQQFVGTDIYSVLVCYLSQHSVSPWSSKEGTVQTSSPSSVDTVTLSVPLCGYTMGQWRVVKSLSMPSLVQCTLFKLKQNTKQPLLELIMYELWMDMSSSACMRTWATSPRAMQSSTPSFLLVSRETRCMDCAALQQIVFAVCLLSFKFVMVVVQ